MPLKIRSRRLNKHIHDHINALYIEKSPQYSVGNVDEPLSYSGA